jgi:hypothetical protein
MDPMKITGTFLDEISHDIPHQNWGKEEWELDFQAMSLIGIDTVILIRSGFHQWMTFPSKVLRDRENCRIPPIDLVSLFLNLCQRYGMSFYFGTYDSGKYWTRGNYQKEIDINLLLIDEVYEKYGDHPAFRGWYLSQEISRRTAGIIRTYSSLGIHCKEISGNLPVMISPWMDGIKSVSAFNSSIAKNEGITLRQHEEEWNDIFDGIREGVDIVAFQDGHVDFNELADFLTLNRRLAERHNLRCWTNSESFDRDMPIKFLPIKWEKLLLKLTTAESVGIEKAITFEFSHFMSPNSCYPQAHHLFNRYREEFGIDFRFQTDGKMNE